MEYFASWSMVVDHIQITWNYRLLRPLINDSSQVSREAHNPGAIEKGFFIRHCFGQVLLAREDGHDLVVALCLEDG